MTNRATLETIMKEQESCPECKGRVVQDRTNGDLVCQNCGLVKEEVLFGDTMEFSANSPECREQGQVLKYDHFSAGGRRGSSIHHSSRDGQGNLLSQGQKRQLNRLRRLDRRCSTKNSSERNLNSSLSELKKMAKLLSLPENVGATAAVFYKFSVTNRLTVGRNAEDFLVASLYCAALKSHYPLTLCGLVGNLERQGWDGSSLRRHGKAVKLLKRKLQLKVAPPSPRMLISRYCAMLDLGSEVERETGELLTRIQEKGLLDGRPGGIAAAAIYIATHLCGGRISQKNLAQVAGVTDMTVRYQYKLISKELNISITRP